MKNFHHQLSNFFCFWLWKAGFLENSMNLSFFLVRAFSYEDPWKIPDFSVFGCSLLLSINTPLSCKYRRCLIFTAVPRHQIDEHYIVDRALAACLLKHLGHWNTRPHFMFPDSCLVDTSFRIPIWNTLLQNTTQSLMLLKRILLWILENSSTFDVSWFLSPDVSFRTSFQKHASSNQCTIPLAIKKKVCVGRGKLVHFSFATVLPVRI